MDTFTDITSGFDGPGNKENPRPRAKADFGFVFHRDIAAIHCWDGRVDGREKAQRSTGCDDSLGDYQDVHPDKDGDALIVMDADNPETGVFTNRGKYNFFGHMRANFVEHVVFNFESQTPERCSKSLKWAYSQDVGVNYNDKVVCVLSEPNDDKGSNEVLVKSHLPNLDLNIPKAKISDKNTPSGANRKIKRGKEVAVTVKGQNLVGTFILTKGKTEYLCKAARVKQTKSTPNKEEYFSGATEARVYFKIPTDEKNRGTGYKLFIKNAGGKSNEIGGFTVTD